MGASKAKPINRLSPLTVKSMAARAKKEGKVEKATDDVGLYFVAEPSRSSWWRFDYQIGGKQKTLLIGTYPKIGMQDVRTKHDDLRKQIVTESTLANNARPSE